MRSEFLYQYDLPVELLDDIPRTEEVLEVAYARSKEKYLIPILITRERIVWAYPETSTVYRVYEMQYIDLVSVYIRYLSQPLPSTIQFTTVNKQQYTFSSLQGNKQQIRSMLLTLADEVKEKTGTDWIVSQKKTLLYEEFWAGTEEHRGAEIISSGDLRDKAGDNQDASDDDFFEDGPLPGKGCFESNEVLFSHFASEGEDVFEEDTPKAAGEDPYAGADDKVARIVETVSAEISKTNAETKAGSADKKAEDDSVIYGPAETNVPADEQWGENKGGDALILENPPKIKPAPVKWGKLHEYSPEEDDSVLYPPVSAGASAENGKPGVQREYGPEDDDSIVYPAPSDEGVVITPIDKSKIEVTEYKILGEETQKPQQKRQDEVILTPMKKPKPEYEPADETEGIKVNAKQAPRDEVLTDHDSLSVTQVQKPAFEVGEDTVPVSPAHEAEAAAAKTPFTEKNRDSILPRNQLKDARGKPAAEAPQQEAPFMKAVTLEPKDGFNPEAVDKLLEELKHLRDTGIITPEEYKERSLKIFKGE